MDIKPENILLFQRSQESGGGERRHLTLWVPKSGVARGLLQGRPLQLPMGWGVGEELTKS